MPVVSIVPILRNRADARTTHTRLVTARARLRSTGAMGYDTALIENEVGDLEEDYAELCIGQDNLIKEARIV